MTAALAFGTALALCYAGMAALSLALDRHYTQLTGSDAPSRGERIGLRLLGAALLTLALWPCIAGWGVSVGMTAWWALLAAGALAVGWLLPYQARPVMHTAVLAGALAVVALLAIRT